jgi:hypothetical protein
LETRRDAAFGAAAPQLDRIREALRLVDQHLNASMIMVPIEPPIDPSSPSEEVLDYLDWCGFDLGLLDDRSPTSADGYASLSTGRRRIDGFAGAEQDGPALDSAVAWLNERPASGADLIQLLRRRPARTSCARPV